MSDCEQRSKLLKMQAELENGMQLKRNMKAEWDAVVREKERLFEIVKWRFRQGMGEQDYLVQKEQVRLVAQCKVMEDDLIRGERLVKGNRDECVSDVKALPRNRSEIKTVNEQVTVENRELLARIAEASEELSAREHEANRRENSLQLQLNEAFRLNNYLTAQIDAQKAEMVEQQERIKARQNEKASVSEMFQQLQSDHETVTSKLNRALAGAEEKAKEALSKYQSEQEVAGKLHKEM